MRNLTWAITGLLNALPRDSVVGVLIQDLNGSEVESPHTVESTFFQVSSSVNVEVLFVSDSYDERAMV